ncbi:OLC1v1003528C1 [Oldenlandia corymbosa var. corymbosa]|uniref:OLC1v1003528C1 n=1 Tax=Oldenlandia corymbosa var. corymbosa TaxID=529605 RepID=A0AAV1DBI5_OLDCO|nr:OLC1v1003528C1 [Oldenlandia corymbosa var. corymbosa]
MDADVDHYVVLGLPSGEEGAKLTEQEITKAYKSMALKLHPDKNRDNPDAHANFHRLKTSYEILKDEKARKLFDDLIRMREEKIRRQSFQDAKRRKMVSDLEERERSAFAYDPHVKARTEEERIARQFKEEVARIRAKFGNKITSPAPPTHHKEKSRTSKGNNKDGSISEEDREKMLKVSWDNVGDDYTAQRLREIFGEFGKVEDVVIMSTKKKKKKRSALIAMASKDAALAATGNVLGDLSNPLLVLPLDPVQASPLPTFSGAQINVDQEEPPLSKFVGAGYQSFEDSVLEKLKKV